MEYYKKCLELKCKYNVHVGKGEIVEYYDCNVDEKTFKWYMQKEDILLSENCIHKEELEEYLVQKILQS